MNHRATRVMSFSEDGNNHMAYSRWIRVTTSHRMKSCQAETTSEWKSDYQAICFHSVMQMREIPNDVKRNSMHSNLHKAMM